MGFEDLRVLIPTSALALLGVWFLIEKFIHSISLLQRKERSIEKGIVALSQERVSEFRKALQDEKELRRSQEDRFKAKLEVAMETARESERAASEHASKSEVLASRWKLLCDVAEVVCQHVHDETATDLAFAHRIGADAAIRVGRGRDLAPDRIHQLATQAGSLVPGILRGKGDLPDLPSAEADVFLTSSLYVTVLDAVANGRIATAVLFGMIKYAREHPGADFSGFAPSVEGIMEETVNELRPVSSQGHLPA